MNESQQLHVVVTPRNREEPNYSPRIASVYLMQLFSCSNNSPVTGLLQEIPGSKLLTGAWSTIVIWLIEIMR
jgi:hypothetical protein